MTNDELMALAKEANERFAKLTPEQQETHREEQKRSWVRGEMALSREVKKHVDATTGAIVYEDYASYCFD